MHHHIVVLEGVHARMPDFEVAPPESYEMTVYNTTTPAELAARLENATIVVATTVKLTAVFLSPEVSPKLKFIAVLGTGTDHVDLAACEARGITVSHTPNGNLEAVSEHAISLYFAVRRRLVMMADLTRAVPSEWKAKGSVARHMLDSKGKLQLTCGEEVAGIMGHGAIGKRIAELARALGMKVLVAGRKGAAGSQAGEGRTPFDEVLKQATVLFVAVPRTPETLSLLSHAEVAAMSPQTVIVNISRGGVVDEEAVFAAVKEARIYGAAADVLAVEPGEGGKDSPLLSDEARALNLIVTPHVAYAADLTVRNLTRMMKENVEGFIQGHPKNVVV